MRTPSTLRVLIGLLLALPAGSLTGQEFQVDPQADRTVRFVSQTTLEDFEGITDRVDGYVLLPDGVGADTDLAGSEFYFEVDLASIDTGISLRNRHMRDNYLETDRFPFASFQGAIAEIQEDGSGFLVSALGTFTVHGVGSERTLRCAITPAGSDAFSVSCRFPVRLQDHDISIPQVMFLKLAEEVTLDLQFVVRAP